MTWTDHGWGALGATELAAIILVWVVVVLGFIALTIGSACCLVTLLLFLFLSFLFTLAVAIFVFIGTKVRYWNEYLGCNTQYKGFYSAWGSVDVYLQAVDELFCSSECPCYFNRTTAYRFINNPISAPYYGLWDTRNLTLKPTRFQDCNDTTLEKAYNNYLMRNAYYNHTLKQKWFHTYYRHIEEFFKCTGFCGTTYNNSLLNTNMKMVKYLFSDVTKGVPEHIGCLERMLDWLQKTMNAFAAVCLFMFVAQVILFIIVLMLLGKMKEEAVKKPRPKPVEEPKKEKPKPKPQPVVVKEEKPKKEPNPDLTDNNYVDPDNSFKPSDSQIKETSMDFYPANFINN